jgi:hypothetical protein
MRKVILGLTFSAIASFASEVTVSANMQTVTATMELMKQGMEQIQNGFLYNNKEMLNGGINTLDNSNKIFQNVDVATFIPNNNKVQVTKNINENLNKNLDALKKAVSKNNVSEATKQYGQVMHNCVSCHTIIRGW